MQRPYVLVPANAVSWAGQRSPSLPSQALPQPCGNACLKLKL